MIKLFSLQRYYSTPCKSDPP